MATYRGCSSGEDEDVSSVTVTKPTAAAAGDIMVLYIICRDATASLSPGGWSALTGGANYKTFTRTMAVGDTSWSVNLGATMDTVQWFIAAVQPGSSETVARAESATGDPDELYYPQQPRAGMVLLFGTETSAVRSPDALSGWTTPTNGTQSTGLTYALNSRHQYKATVAATGEIGTLESEATDGTFPGYVTSVLIAAQTGNGYFLGADF